MQKSNKILTKDVNLTETFVKVDVNDADMSALQSAIEAANKALDYGELLLVGGKNRSVGIYSKILINTNGAKNNIPVKCEDSIRGLATYLQAVSLGVARSLNDELKTPSYIRNYLSTVVVRSLSNAQSISLLVKQVDADEVIEHLMKQMDKLEGYEILVSEGREGLIKHVLDRDYWEGICNKAFNSVVKQMDAKALRIGLSQSMDVL
ncbi:MAG: hypothetical protein J6N72_09450 [Psychrobacter sp.]|nr:hypothetical protein [Psychrobacter sp.]